MRRSRKLVARLVLDDGLFLVGGHGEGCWTRPALKGVM
jgi:hypothetical protein